jgi:hypothetical protein
MDSDFPIMKAARALVINCKRVLTLCTNHKLGNSLTKALSGMNNSRTDRILGDMQDDGVQCTSISTTSNIVRQSHVLPCFCIVTDEPIALV